jgi:hypothetical protein
VQVEGDDSLLPPLAEPPDAKKPRPKTSRGDRLRDRLHLAPMLTPHGGGIGLTWEND